MGSLSVRLRRRLIVYVPYLSKAPQPQKIAFFGCSLRFPYRMATGVPISLNADLTNCRKGRLCKQIRNRLI